MTKAVFFREESGAFTGFCLTGHAMLSTEGSDILCAAITAMVQMTVNTLTEDLGLSVQVGVDPNRAEISAQLPPHAGAAAQALLNGFHRELATLAKAYPHNLSLREKQA